MNGVEPIGVALLLFPLMLLMLLMLLLRGTGLALEPVLTIWLPTPTILFPFATAREGEAPTKPTLLLLFTSLLEEALLLLLLLFARLLPLFFFLLPLPPLDPLPLVAPLLLLITNCEFVPLPIILPLLLFPLVLLLIEFLLLLLLVVITLPLLTPPAPYSA